ncbi:hypothetical protein E1264_23815 [Actinomadura sp. KC216]|nr:hypothetical protein E1264_23815 [Actinomadura sp. KC216]
MALLAVIPLGAAALQGAIWFVGRAGASVIESIVAVWALVLMAVVATVTVQMLRLVLVRPRMWVAGDEIVIWDGLLLWKALRIPRTSIAAVRHGGEPDRRHHEEAAHLTPFGQEVNLVLRLRDALPLPARRLRWGNWFWVMLSSSGDASRPTIPQRGRPVRSLWLRVKAPRRVAIELDRWLMDEETAPPQRFTSVDHVFYGRLRTYHGAGNTRLKIKGRLVQPVLAEFAYEGSGTLRGSLRRTEFGRGVPVVACGPGPTAAVIVLDDRLVTEEEAARRFLNIEAEGSWTVTIGGPDRARSFTRSATGHGPEVLTYEGPPGIAVLTSPGGEFHEVHLRGPDLSALYGGDPVAFAGALGQNSAHGSPAPSLSAFAVPSGAILQIRTNRTEWRIDVTPLDQADVDSPRHSGPEGEISIPPTGHVRPFEGFIAGDRAAVVRYLGPPGRVQFRADAGFGLVHLDAALVPLRTLTTPAADQSLDLRSHALIQVTGGSGTWSIQEAHPAQAVPPGSGRCSGGPGPWAADPTHPPANVRDSPWRWSSRCGGQGALPRAM